MPASATLHEGKMCQQQPWSCWFTNNPTTVSLEWASFSPYKPASPSFRPTECFSRVGCLDLPLWCENSSLLWQTNTCWWAGTFQTQDVQLLELDFKEKCIHLGIHDMGPPRAWTKKEQVGIQEKGGPAVQGPELGSWTREQEARWGAGKGTPGEKGTSSSIWPQRNHGEMVFR